MNDEILATLVGFVMGRAIVNNIERFTASYIFLQVNELCGKEVDPAELVDVIKSLCHGESPLLAISQDEEGYWFSPTEEAKRILKTSCTIH